MYVCISILTHTYIYVLYTYLSIYLSIYIYVNIRMCSYYVTMYIRLEITCSYDICSVNGTLSWLWPAWSDVE